MHKDMISQQIQKTMMIDDKTQQKATNFFFFCKIQENAEGGGRGRGEGKKQKKHPEIINYTDILLLLLPGNCSYRANRTTDSPSNMLSPTRSWSSPAWSVTISSFCKQ